MRAHRPAAAAPAGSSDNRTLTIAIAGSLLLHLALASVIVPARLPTASPPEARPVRIALVPENPLRAPEPAVSAAPTRPESQPEPVIAPDPGEPTAADVDAPPETAAATPPPQAPPPAPVVTVPAVELPDSRAVLQSLQQLQQARASRLYQFDCDERQRRSDLLDCGDEDTARDYEALTTNPTYRALNPVRELTRSQRTVGTITQNAAGLAARLRDSDVDPQLQEYLLQELEIGISEHANQRQSAVETIIRMTDQSAAAQQAREILGDPWVIQRARELRERRVTDP